jgi:thymidylate synthase (FAD)
MKAELINSMGTDNTVVDAARVSFDKTSGNYTYEQNAKLIDYLAKHEHYSPFGHCFASFHVKAPIFVRSQLVKHEYLRMNEISRRYVDTPPEFFIPEVWRAKSGDKKQGSIRLEEQPIGWMGVDVGTHDFYIQALERYNWMIKIGIAPEQARMVLPQSMYTEWYWSGSLDAFANMANLRCKPDAQEETRFIANQISEQMRTRFPLSWKALTNGS